MTEHARAIEILLVEDSPTDRLMAAEVLRQASIANHLHTVENGIEAMAYLRREGRYATAARPDLILLDLNLPRKDGREVLAEIKTDQRLKVIPVIVMTTSAAAEDVSGSYSHHANSFIRKPIDFARFAEIINSVGHYWCQVVTLPVPKPSPWPTPPPFGRRSSSVVTSSLRVLLVEDDPTGVLLVKEMLRESRIGSFDVESVSRIRALAERPDLDSFHIALVDLNLPDSQGLDTYRQVRSALGGRPVIVLTGLHDESLGLSALREGAQDYLVKGELTASGLARALRYAVDRRSTEEQLRQAQRMEAIGQLAAGVAHDFNNILTVIHGQAQLLAESPPAGQDSSAAVTDIIDASTRGAALTRQLLTFSRQQILRPQVLDVDTVLEGVARLLRRLLGAHVALELQLDANRTVEADLSMLEQVVINLAVNARDAMPDGGTLTLATSVVEITHPIVSEEPDAYPGTFVKLTVSDSGSGIEPDILPRIFEPYFTTKDVGKGTGLGLPTVFTIVQQHRGWIHVSSVPRRGTTFEVHLPASALAASPAIPPAPVMTMGKETILLVEDEPGVRRMATQALSRRGYRVIAAASGVEALKVWETEASRIDLLFTDLVMPERMSGQQLASILRAARPDLKVLFTSGYSSDFVGGGTPLVTGRNFVQKPYRLSDLSNAVRACLDAEVAP